MFELGLFYNKVYKKFVCIVGEVLGKYYLYGDFFVYDIMVCMVQDWFLCYFLVDGQGNFGSMDGDSFVVMCYIEVCLCWISDEMLVDINKDIVDFVFNFDDMLQELIVFFVCILNFLVNGVFGIVVGMVINMLLYNFSEVIDGMVVIIDNLDIIIDELMQFIKVFDFFIGGIIFDYQGIKDVFYIGCGCVVVCGKVEIIIDNWDCEMIIIFEIFYQVNKVNLVVKIVELVGEKIDGISDVWDELDCDGLCIVVEVKCDVMVSVVLSKFYKYMLL